MKLKDFEKAINDFCNSEEGYLYFEKVKNRNIIYEKQLDRFDEMDNKIYIIEKIINKYNSKEYREKWFNKLVEPTESLYYFLFDYSRKYGRECTYEEINEYSCDFTSSMFYYLGYIFARQDGQGEILRL